MKRKKIFLGDTFFDCNPTKVAGGFVTIEGEKYYKIRNYHQMPDFLMTIVSDSNHWNYISSNGSLSAGRKDRDNALFPYYTSDKIHDYHDITGSKTILLVGEPRRYYIWEPFSKEHSSVYKIERNLYKSVYGNKLIFEEINEDLELTFRYGWFSSEEYGFVKKSSIISNSSSSLRIEILDGIQNILPSDTSYAFQNEYSNLLDAYKKNELLKETGLGLFMLSSIPVDKAEPSESLNTTTVWSKGLAKPKILISTNQIENFKCGMNVKTELDVRAARGAYFVNSEIDLEPDHSTDWMFIAEINQSTTDVANLNHFLKSQINHSKLVIDDIEKGTENLKRIVAGADGMQCSYEELNSARHFSNTLFNVMRGGIYLNNYVIEAKDFRKFVKQTNKMVYKQALPDLQNLPAEILVGELKEIARKLGNTNFIRICDEYLPLTFSRRHGDPSRPWNQFSIDNKNEDGSPKSDYQGNWRDIFQNWEALSLSYPGYIENIIGKFLNATTPDGYNPYRIMRDGIDWEAPDPDDPWAYIGYWGDHQIIYLQKLLEISKAYHPGKLEELLTKEIFAYANVPYRIKLYSEIIRNPRDTIEFDFQLNDEITTLVEKIGADGRMLLTGEDHIVHANLTEKILVTLLAKLSNYIPEAGIWLNTQRPEWNDANNALVGNGVSMVTLYYLHRFIKFWEEVFTQSTETALSISEEIHTLFETIFSLFANNTEIIKSGFSDKDRYHFAEVLGEAGSEYRQQIYKHGFSGRKVEVKAAKLVEFMHVALEHIEHSIRKNKREDGLYHAYNLISFSEKGLSIRYLYPMLEGQVAVLSSGYLSAEECLDVLDHLKKSSLFRADQYSYILYPDRQLPRFTEKNNISENQVERSALLKKLVTDKNTDIIEVDKAGHYHFNSSFRNADALEKALEKLDSAKYSSLVEDKKLILKIYEEMFDHQSFTGRSGTFYGYEGLGSIYWHMVSKLLLAVEENFLMGIDDGASAETLGKLKEHYYEIKAGIGLYKSPELYGAIPTDAYSHTPGNAGAKQPGMTGQVKEDVISRMGELGVRVKNGEIVFDPALINKKEFLQKEMVFDYMTLCGKSQQLNLRKKQMAFTLCQVPVIYTLSDTNKINVIYSDNGREEFEGNKLDNRISKMIFSRTSEIAQIEISIKQ
jgi:hypothetical protein